MSDHYAMPPSLSIPYRDIDAEHEGLIELLNAISRVLQSKQIDSDHSVEKLLAAFREALKGHFRHEEQEMADLRFPDLAQHKIEHAHCAARLNKIIHEVTIGKMVMNKNILDELFDVIIGDFIRADSTFKSFLYAQNILP